MTDIILNLYNPLMRQEYIRDQTQEDLIVEIPNNKNGSNSNSINEPSESHTSRVERAISSEMEKVAKFLNDTYIAIVKERNDNHLLVIELKRHNNILRNTTSGLLLHDKPRKGLHEVISTLHSLDLDVPMGHYNTIAILLDYYLENDFPITSSGKLFESLTYVNNRVDEYIQWFQFLIELYAEFSKYKYQSQREKYNVADVHDWQMSEKPQGIHINKSNYQKFLTRLKGNRVSVTIPSDPHLLHENEFFDSLNGVLYATLREKPKYECVSEGSMMTLTAKAAFLLLSEVKQKFNSCGKKIQTVKVFATNTIFLDVSIADHQGDRLSLYLLAPKWYIDDCEHYEMNLSGTDSPNATLNKIDAGKPGIDGIPSGNFVGIVQSFTNPHGLNIKLDGGNGGSGHKGRDGKNGVSYHNQLDYIKKVYCGESQSIDNTPFTNSSLPNMTIYLHCNEKTEFLSPPDNVAGENGDNGGDGGAGGAKGHFIFIELNSKKSSIEISNQDGKCGAGGASGKGARSGIGVRVRVETVCNHSLELYVSKVFIERDFSKEVGRDGLKGVCPVNKAPATKIDPSIIFNEFKTFTWEHTTNSFHSPVISPFLEEIYLSEEINSYSNTVLSYIDELNQMGKMADHALFFHFYYQKLERFYEKLKEQPNTNEINNQFHALYIVLTAMLPMKIRLEEAEDNTLYLDLPGYLTKLKEDIKEVADLKSKQIRNLEHTANIADINDKIAVIEDLKKANAVRNVSAIAKNLNNTLSAYKTYEYYQSIIDILSETAEITESMDSAKAYNLRTESKNSTEQITLLNNLLNKADQDIKSTLSGMNDVFRGTLVKSELNSPFDSNEGHFNSNETNQTFEKVYHEVLINDVVDISNKNHDKLLKLLSNAEDLKKIKDLVAFALLTKTQTLSRTVPNAMRTNTNAVDKGLIENNQFYTNFQAILGNVQRLINTTERGLNQTDDKELLVSLKNLSDAIAILIGVYKELDILEKQRNNSEYLKNINLIKSVKAKGYEFHNDKLEQAVYNAEIQIRYNLIVWNYNLAYNSMKLAAFPYASEYFGDVVVERDLDKLVSRIENQIDSFLYEYVPKEEVVAEFGPDGGGETMLVRRRRDQHSGDYCYDNENDWTMCHNFTEHAPIHTWDGYLYKEEIAELLSGNVTFFRANAIANNLEAIKVNTVQLNFLLHQNGTDFQKSLTKALSTIMFVLTHTGTSQYRWGNKTYTIQHRSLKIEQSFEKHESLLPARHNDVYLNMKSNIPIISPFTLWKVQLISTEDSSKKRKENFIDLKKFIGLVDLQLIGEGTHAKHKRWNVETWKNFNYSLGNYYKEDNAPSKSQQKNKKYEYQIVKFSKLREKQQQMSFELSQLLSLANYEHDKIVEVENDPIPDQHGKNISDSTSEDSLFLNPNVSHTQALLLNHSEPFKEPSNNLICTSQPRRKQRSLDLFPNLPNSVSNKNLEINLMVKSSASKTTSPLNWLFPTLLFQMVTDKFFNYSKLAKNYLYQRFTLATLPIPRFYHSSYKPVENFSNGFEMSSSDWFDVVDNTLLLAPVLGFYLQMLFGKKKSNFKLKIRDLESAEISNLNERVQFAIKHGFKLFRN